MKTFFRMEKKSLLDFRGVPLPISAIYLFLILE